MTYSLVVSLLQITATTDHATGQALLYALTRAGYVWQFDFSKQRWLAYDTSLAADEGAGVTEDYQRALRGTVGDDQACRSCWVRRAHPHAFGGAIALRVATGGYEP